MSSTQDVSPRLRTREDLYDLICSGDLTRTDLVERTGLSRSTVNQAVTKLLATGRITESDVEDKGPGSGSGRPATLLRAIASGGPVAGIDFGHNHVHVAVADALGRPIGHAEARIDVDLDASGAIDAATDLLAVLRETHGLQQMTSVVAGIPGPLDLRTGLVQSPTILSSWVGLVPARQLESRLDVPVHVENDAVLGALGELAEGAGRRIDNFLYVKASHGIGAAMIIDRKPFRGTSGIAGEIGHTHLDGHSELCRCGNRGCLEAAASVATIREQIAHTRPGTDPASIDLAHVDDAIARRVLNEAGRTIGGVLALLCNMLNPAAVIVGGEVGASGSAVIDGIRSSIGRHAQPSTVEALEVRAAELGTRAEVVGAVHLAASRARQAASR